MPAITGPGPCAPNRYSAGKPPTFLLVVLDICGYSLIRYFSLQRLAALDNSRQRVDCSRQVLIFLGGRKGRSSAILVMNDEAHHAYRNGATDVPDPFDEADETTERVRVFLPPPQTGTRLARLRV